MEALIVNLTKHSVIWEESLSHEESVLGWPVDTSVVDGVNN